MLTKYTTCEILDINYKRSRLDEEDRNLKSLEKKSNFDAVPVRVDDGYLYLKVRSISSRVNKNHDGWPAEELAGMTSDEFRSLQAKLDEEDSGKISGEKLGRVLTSNKVKTKGDYGFKTFVGRPFFVDHNNSDPDRMRGVVVDALLHVEPTSKRYSSQEYWATAPDNHKPETWIECMVEIDAEAFPKLAQAIISGDIDSVSMGCNVEYTECSVCGNEAEALDDYCAHIKNKGQTFKTKEGKVVKAYEDCYGVNFFELSAVFDPADVTAITTGPILHKNASTDLNWEKVAKEWEKTSYYIPGYHAALLFRNKVYVAPFDQDTYREHMFTRGRDWAEQDAEDIGMDVVPTSWGGDPYWGHQGLAEEISNELYGDSQVTNEIYDRSARGVYDPINQRLVAFDQWDEDIEGIWERWGPASVNANLPVKEFGITTSFDARSEDEVIWSNANSDPIKDKEMPDVPVYETWVEQGGREQTDQLLNRFFNDKRRNLSSTQKTAYYAPEFHAALLVEGKVYVAPFDEDTYRLDLKGDNTRRENEKEMDFWGIEREEQPMNYDGSPAMYYGHGGLADMISYELYGNQSDAGSIYSNAKRGIYHPMKQQLVAFQGSGNTKLDWDELWGPAAKAANLPVKQFYSTSRFSMGRGVRDNMWLNVNSDPIGDIMDREPRPDDLLHQWDKVVGPQRVNELGEEYFNDGRRRRFFPDWMKETSVKEARRLHPKAVEKIRSIVAPLIPSIQKTVEENQSNFDFNSPDYNFHHLNEILSIWKRLERGKLSERHLGRLLKLLPDNINKQELSQILDYSKRGIDFDYLHKRPTDVGLGSGARFHSSWTKWSEAKSKQQFKLMKGICEGNITDSDIPKSVACEMVEGKDGKKHQSPKGLPKKKKKDSSSKFPTELPEGEGVGPGSNTYDLEAGLWHRMENKQIEPSNWTTLHQQVIKMRQEDDKWRNNANAEIARSYQDEGVANSYGQANRELINRDLARRNRRKELFDKYPPIESSWKKIAAAPEIVLEVVNQGLRSEAPGVNLIEYWQLLAGVVPVEWHNELRRAAVENDKQRMVDALDRIMAGEASPIGGTYAEDLPMHEISQRSDRRKNIREEQGVGKRDESGRLIWSKIAMGPGGGPAYYMDQNGETVCEQAVEEETANDVEAERSMLEDYYWDELRNYAEENELEEDEISEEDRQGILDEITNQYGNLLRENLSQIDPEGLYRYVVENDWRYETDVVQSVINELYYPVWESSEVEYPVYCEVHGDVLEEPWVNGSTEFARERFEDFLARTSPAELAQLSPWEAFQLAWDSSVENTYGASTRDYQIATDEILADVVKGLSSSNSWQNKWAETMAGYLKNTKDGTRWIDYALEKLESQTRMDPQREEEQKIRELTDPGAAKVEREIGGILKRDQKELQEAQQYAQMGPGVPAGNPRQQQPAQNWWGDGGYQDAYYDPIEGMGMSADERQKKLQDRYNLGERDESGRLKWTKVAMPYHMAPKDRRDSIREHGLDYTKSESFWGDQGQYENIQEPGNYFIRTPNDMPPGGMYGPQFGREFDVWHFTEDALKDKKVKQDTEIGEMHDEYGNVMGEAYYTQEPIEPEYLTLEERRDLVNEGIKAERRRKRLMRELQKDKGRGLQWSTEDDYKRNRPKARPGQLWG